METQLAIYKGYKISTEEGVEKGIFFRNPIQKVYFDAYDYISDFSAWEYLKKIKNPIRRLYEFLIGNGEILSSIESWAKKCNWGGFKGNILCSPIYFKRDYRKLTATTSEDNLIQKIESYGYESEFNWCAGDCDIEKTKIHLSSGRVIHIKRRETYYYTYLHLIKKMIDSRDFEI